MIEQVSCRPLQELGIDASWFSELLGKADKGYLSPCSEEGAATAILIGFDIESSVAGHLEMPRVIRLSRAVAASDERVAEARQCSAREPARLFDGATLHAGEGIDRSG